MKISRKQRLIFTICLSFSFFAAELSGQSYLIILLKSSDVNIDIVGFYTHSIALIADAFHYVRSNPTSKIPVHV